MAKKFPMIEVWDDVVGSSTVADERPICIFIISPPAEIAEVMHCAIKPRIAPATKFKISPNISAEPDGTTVGFIIRERMIVLKLKQTKV